MILGTIEKQPLEKLPFSISYDAVVGTRTLTDLSVTAAVTPGGAGAPTLTDTSTSVPDKKHIFYVNGGTSNVEYLITFTATLTIGGITEVVEDELYVSVADIPAA